MLCARIHIHVCSSPHKGAAEPVDNEAGKQASKRRRLQVGTWPCHGAARCRHPLTDCVSCRVRGGNNRSVNVGTRGARYPWKAEMV